MMRRKRYLLLAVKPPVSLSRLEDGGTAKSLPSCGPSAWALGLLAVLLLTSKNALALDVLDLFKFHRNVEVKLQANGSRYSLADPHGVVSPFTSYIGSLASKFEKSQSIFKIEEIQVPHLEQGGLMIEFVDPKKRVGLEDPVFRRNYVGLQEFFMIPRNLEDVFKGATDYEHLNRVLPGMKEATIRERKANRIDVENWRKTDTSVFGKRKSYYCTTNIISESAVGAPPKKVIKSQLLEGDKKKSKRQAMMFLDSLWYFESCGEECTLVYHLSFSLLKFDYKKTPLFFPFLAKEVRRQVVQGVMEGAALSALSSIIKWQDVHFRDRPLESLSEEETKQIARESQARLEKLKAEGRLKIDWKAVFD